MEFAEIAGRVLLASLVAVIFIVVLAMFVRRLLGVAVGLGRIIVAGVLGLGVEVAFESRFIWQDPNASWQLIPVQIGIVLLVASLFLMIAELVIPTGTIVRPDKWVTSTKNRLARTRRYSEVTRIDMGSFPHAGQTVQTLRRLPRSGPPPAGPYGWHCKNPG
jgi:ubiquinone biosynthesis protein